MSNVNDTLRSQQGKQRAVLIFFKNLDVLLEFKNWTVFAKYSQFSLTLDESMKNQERINVISRATYSG